MNKRRHDYLNDGEQDSKCFMEIQANRLGSNVYPYSAFAYFLCLYYYTFKYSLLFFHAIVRVKVC